MKPTPITHNEKPVAGTIRNRLIFVFSTATPSPQKDSDNDPYHIFH